jgi:hypothetical protein
MRIAHLRIRLLHQPGSQRDGIWQGTNKQTSIAIWIYSYRVHISHPGHSVGVMTLHVFVVFWRASHKVGWTEGPGDLQPIRATVLARSLAVCMYVA